MKSKKELLAAVAIALATVVPQQATAQLGTMSYSVMPYNKWHQNEGWGVSLCWWANMCGNWSDSKIDQLVTWLVSPEGLNCNIFRYNIPGGDDPNNANCTLHHMDSGKGRRAEMEGFKTSSSDSYDWTRDAAQRKIMLKIKEMRPDAIFEAFSNTPPYYMTYSGCCAGNTDANKDNLKPEYYEEFAHYLVDVCKHYKDEYGIEFKTLEPFNEPNTNYWYAGGSQEGCHFDIASQTAFLKVLSPILKESGLNTVISASDETNVDMSVSEFNSYLSDGTVMPMLGQWNTHSYSGSIVSKSRIGSLARANNLPLWQSETGDGGSGLAGNLKLAKRLIEDIRYMHPAAWVDWQYVEEWNDQWCTVKGDFAAQTMERVKNYYVREQVTQHIKKGYSFVTSLSDSTLAAVNSKCDTLVLVAINTTGNNVKHNVDISGYKINGEPIVYRTTTSESHKAITNGCSYGGSIAAFNMPPVSIMTIIMPISPLTSGVGSGISTGTPYIIIPQYNWQAALTDDNGTVKIANMEKIAEGSALLKKSQTWYFKRKSNGIYTIQSGEGKLITGSTGYQVTTSKTAADTGQAFSIESVDGIYSKIMSADFEGKCLDLESEKYSADTNVGLWNYGTLVTAGHRHWYLVPVIENPIDNAIRTAGLEDNSGEERYYSLQGIRLQAPSKGLNIVVSGNNKARKVLY